LIYTLRHCDPSIRRKIVYIVKNNSQDKKKVDWVIQQVVATGGIRYASDQMNHYKDQALAVLGSFPESEVRKGLEDMVLFVTDRKF